MDMHNDIKVSRGLSPVAAVTDNTAYVSQIIDTANFSATEFLILIGSNTDAYATFSVLVEDDYNASLTENAAVDGAVSLCIRVLPRFDFSDYH